MISAIAQTLAEILSSEISFIRKEQIYFNHPGTKSIPGLRLNLYCYDLREHCFAHAVSDPDASESISSENSLAKRVDVSFLISVWDSTALSEQHLISEVLTLLLRHHFLPEASLAPVLRHQGLLPMRVSGQDLSETAQLWRALGVPLRPSVQVVVTVPFCSHGSPCVVSQHN
ncbi:Pvc16 family protein [Phormidesmis sp. 146-12]